MDPVKAPPPPVETKLHFLDYWRIIRIRKTVILAVFLLVVVTATLVTFILPKSYVSTVRIKVEKDTPDIAPITEQRILPGYDPYFIQTEFEIVKSKRILERVVGDTELRLPEVWAKRFNQPGKLSTSEATAVLRGKIDLRQVRNTSLIEIRVFSEDKEEAARIANKIAEVYKAFRLEQRKELTFGGIDALKDELAMQGQVVTNLQREVDYLRTNLNVSDTMALADTPTPLVSVEMLRQYEMKRMEVESQLAREEASLAELHALTSKELREVLPGYSPDPILPDLLQKLIQSENELVTMKQDLGEAHPQVRKINVLARDLNDKINDRVRGIMKGFDTRVKALRAEFEKVESSVETAKRKDREDAQNNRPYYDKKRELDRQSRIRDMLALKIYTEKVDINLPRTVIVDITDRAEPGLRPVKPNKALNIFLGVIVGLVVGVGLAFFIEYLDTSVKTIDDVERALQAPVLGVIPQNVAYIMEEGAESPHAEAYRVLRTNLLFARKDDKMTSIVVISAGAGEGKSTTVINLATVFAQSGQRVVVVDSDLRRPTLHKVLGVSNSIGLTSYLLKQNTLEEVIQTTQIPTMDLLPSGKLPSSSMGILNSKQMEDLIRELKQRYDYVFFDSPPMMGLSDAAILASEMDITLQVIQYRRYPQPMTIRAKQMVEKVGGNLLGIVLNNINMSQDENYYYYSGYYHDYYAKDEDKAEGVAVAATDAKAKLDIKQKY